MNQSNSKWGEKRNTVTPASSNYFRVIGNRNPHHRKLFLSLLNYHIMVYLLHVLGRAPLGSTYIII